MPSFHGIVGAIGAIDKRFEKINNGIEKVHDTIEKPFVRLEKILFDDPTHGDTYNTRGTHSYARRPRGHRNSTVRHSLVSLRRTRARKMEASDVE